MDALYESQRLGPGKAMGHAEICMPEFEKAGELVLDFASLLPFSSISNTETRYWVNPTPRFLTGLFVRMDFKRRNGTY